MRDIPAFTTDNGVASLTLSEIPYKQAAYIRIHDSCEVELFLKECCDFCRTVGAQRIFATGHTYLEQYPIFTSIVRMTRSRDSLPETDAALFPVRENTLEQWRALHNEKMSSIPNSAYMTELKAREQLKKGNAYFVHRGDLLLGIGVASGDTIEALATVVPGSGQDVLLALNHALSGDQICMEVASANTRAVALYQRLGFIKTEELSVWHQII